MDVDAMSKNTNFLKSIKKPIIISSIIIIK